MLKTHRYYLILLVTYLGVGSLYALYTPAWQAPDEPAHYNYIRQLAGGSFPVMEQGDYDQAYQNEVIGSRFDPVYSVEPFSYQDYQPPLYYLVQTPVYWASGGNLFAMRLFGVVLGGLTLTVAYLFLSALSFSMARIVDKQHDIFPGLPLTLFIPLIFFAFLPQHISLQASLNNDSLAELLIASALLALFFQVQVWIGQPVSRPTGGLWTLFAAPWALPIILGLCLLTKVTAYLMVIVTGLTLLWALLAVRTSSTTHRISQLIQLGFQTFLLPFLIGCIWWVRNLVIYGWPDFLGTDAHDAVVIGQPTTPEWINQFGAVEVATRFLQTSFRSFWGQFGWMGVVMPRWIYLALGLFSLIVFVGYLLALYQSNRSASSRLGFPKQTISLGIISGNVEAPADHSDIDLDQISIRLIHRAMLALFVLNLILYLAYNMTFVQHQGRYLFSSLIPISYAVGIGILFWVRVTRLTRLTPLVTLLFFIGLVGLDLWALFRYIVPALQV